MGIYHFNTEALLGLAYIIVCFTLLIFTSFRLPTSIKKKINGLVQYILYFLLWGALVPAWILFSSTRTLNQLASKKPEALLVDKHKGKVLKQQRNVIIGSVGLLAFFVLFRMNKMLARYEGIDVIEPVSPTAIQPSAATQPPKYEPAPAPAPSAPKSADLKKKD